MENFEYRNPTRIVFGRGTISRLAELLKPEARILLVAGGGSIRKNGVYEQVRKALSGHKVIEFWGIEPNPEYETCLKAVKAVKENNVDFLLAVGGGSVLDATKFIAAAALYDGPEAWDIMADRGSSLQRALPLGSVLTLPATGSEMNANSVISRRSINAKQALINPVLMPTFSILDPETTYTLPPRQVANGVVDAFVHVAEQYLTVPARASVQDRWAEGVMLTLIEEGPRALSEPEDYDVRANIMWAATCALNGFISLGVPGDWATHMIGHEITALYGLDHACSLAVVLPGLLEFQKVLKKDKLLQYAERVWGLSGGDDGSLVNEAIAKTEGFFRQMGVMTRLSEYGVDDASAPAKIADNRARLGLPLGEHGNVGRDEIAAIMKNRM